MSDLAAVRDLKKLAEKQAAIVQEQRKELAAIRADLRELRDEQRYERKWRQRFARQADAILRAAYLEISDNPVTARFQLRSQNEEDGISLYLLRAAGAQSRSFVELGCGRTGGNSGVLAGELGWSGLMVDIVPENVRRAAERYRHNPKVTQVCAAVSPENVNELLADYPAPDFFSLDIDSIDYWVVEAMEARPLVMCLEYNWLFGAERAVTIPRDADLSNAPKGYHGASLAALDKLLRGRGYRLVCCDPTGTNAFFLRDGAAPDVPTLTAAEAWRPGRSGDSSRINGLPVTEV